jgi:hypothetical protein
MQLILRSIGAYRHVLINHRRLTLGAQIQVRQEQGTFKRTKNTLCSPFYLLRDLQTNTNPSHPSTQTLVNHV